MVEEGHRSVVDLKFERDRQWRKGSGNDNYNYDVVVITLVAANAM